MCWRRWRPLAGKAHLRLMREASPEPDGRTNEAPLCRCQAAESQSRLERGNHKVTQRSGEEKAFRMLLKKQVSAKSDVPPEAHFKQK